MGAQLQSQRPREKNSSEPLSLADRMLAETRGLTAIWHQDGDGVETVAERREGNVRL
jgi:hypothetical protein